MSDRARSGMRARRVWVFAAAVVLVAVLLSLGVAGAFGRTPPPEVSIVSPVDGTATGADSVDVTVHFRPSVRRSGKVSLVELLVDGEVMARRTITPPVKEGTVGLVLDVSGLPEGDVVLQARAYEGNPKAGRFGLSEPVTLVIDREDGDPPPPFDGTATPVLDEAGAASATVGRAGGSLSAGGVMLTVPAGALLEDVEITMTPISDLADSPLEGTVIGGVRLEPDGLLFLKAARLTMALPDGVAAADVLGFGSATDGSNLHLVPGVVADGGIGLDVWHFSTAGASSGGASAAGALIAYTPSGAQQQAEASIALWMNGLGGTPGGGFPADDPFVTEILRAWFTSSVKPGLQQAFGQGQEAFERAVAEWVAWEGYVETFTPNQLLSERAEAASLATSAGVELAGALLARCTGFVDFHPPLRDVIRFSLLVDQIELPIAGEVYGGRALPSATNLPGACMHVEIESVEHAPVLAVLRANAFTVKAGVAFWNGPVNHSIPLRFRLTDVTAGAGVPVDSSTEVDGEWQTSEKPASTGSWLLDLEVELEAAGADDSLKAFTARRTLNIPVRDRVELQARAPGSASFTDAVAPIHVGDTVELRVRLAGDGMSGANVSLELNGTGQVSATSGTTGADGVASFSFAAPAGSTPGNAVITATSGDASDSLTIVVKLPVAVSVSPTVAALVVGGTRQFTATVENADDTDVTWTATGGTISQGGLYTAGSTPGTFTVTATSVEDPAKSDSATVTITGGGGTVTKTGHFPTVVSATAWANCSGTGGHKFAPAGVTEWSDSITISKSEEGESGAGTGSLSFTETYAGSHLTAVTASATGTTAGLGECAVNNGATGRYKLDFRVEGGSVPFTLTGSFSVAGELDGCSASRASVQLFRVDVAREVVFHCAPLFGGPSLALTGALEPGTYTLDVLAVASGAPANVSTRVTLTFGS